MTSPSSAGLSVEMASLAYSLMDSYNYGFALQQHNLPFEAGSDIPSLALGLLEQLPADQYPYLTELTVEHIMLAGYDYGAEFEYGLDLILDGLEQARRKAARAQRTRKTPRTISQSDQAT